MTKRMKQSQPVEPVEVKPEVGDEPILDMILERDFEMRELFVHVDPPAPTDRDFMLSELRDRFEVAKLAGKVDEMITILDEIVALEKNV
jgi:hypothetical protein